MTTAALASVACPHSGTSVTGVNQRMRQQPAVMHPACLPARDQAGALQYGQVFRNGGR